MRTALAVLLSGLCCAAQAQAIFFTQSGNVTVELHEEKCGIEAPINLPFKAVWRDAEKVYEGCWSVSPFGFVMMYFDDKTMGIAPVQAFKRLSRT